MESNLINYIVEFDNGNYLGFSGGLYVYSNVAEGAVIFQSEDQVEAAIASRSFWSGIPYQLVEICVHFNIGSCGGY